jgi:hypothetical protein
VALSREVPADEQPHAQADCDVLVVTSSPSAAAGSDGRTAPADGGVVVEVASLPPLAAVVDGCAAPPAKRPKRDDVADPCAAPPAVAQVAPTPAIAAVEASVVSVADVSVMDVSVEDEPVSVPSTVRALLAMSERPCVGTCFSLPGVVETVALLPTHMRFSILDPIDLSQRLEVRYGSYLNGFADGAAPRPGDRVHVLGQVRHTPARHLGDRATVDVIAHRILVDR